MIYKIIWAFQGLLLSFFFGSYKFPSYVSFPIFSIGLRKVHIGKKVRIFKGFRVETHGSGEIHINDDVSIGQNFHITSAGKIVIEPGVIISANVFVTDIDHEYRDIKLPVSSQPLIISNTCIGQNSFIGIGACIQAGTKLGKHCVVGCNSVVRGSFPDYSVIVGAPAKIVKRYNKKTNSWDKTDSKGNFLDEI
ncbi:DapH/DapD/GlmU-related protein [Vibrio tapetis]|uniref:Bacterial transferase hexapeptide repeat protein n=1 Tax=Vibrio tapetis subsp. tapetis TaxID=1671868 RepID=A0A2N8ZGH8_9VIBR|nr:DapH/DapD/GlmU-related protein [Vibrio tapetis]SON51004.1 Bacterial transferase hexapeptide repeat protein [Vibrio tapetis subsp. tapetis]